MIRITRTGARVRSIRAAGLAAFALALAACGGADDAPAEPVEGVLPGIEVDNARMVLNAVEGNPAAVYFDLTYAGDRGLTIRKAEVEQAKSSSMHDFGEYDFKVQMMDALPVAITQGSEIAFQPGGLHVMAFEPSPELKPGDKAQVTITVSGGQTHKFDAEVMAAGDPRAAGAKKDGDAS